MNTRQQREREDRRRDRGATAALQAGRGARGHPRVGSCPRPSRRNATFLGVSSCRAPAAVHLSSNLAPTPRSTLDARLIAEIEPHAWLNAERFDSQARLKEEIAARMSRSSESSRGARSGCVPARLAKSPPAIKQRSGLAPKGVDYYSRYWWPTMLLQPFVDNTGGEDRLLLTRNCHVRAHPGGRGGGVEGYGGHNPGHRRTPCGED